MNKGSAHDADTTNFRAWRARTPRITHPAGAIPALTSVSATFLGGAVPGCTWQLISGLPDFLTVVSGNFKDFVNATSGLSV